MQTAAPTTPHVKTLLARALLLILAGASISLTACNTTAGAGRDIQSAGRGIEGAAESSK